MGGLICLTKKGARREAGNQRKRMGVEDGRAWRMDMNIWRQKERRLAWRRWFEEREDARKQWWVDWESARRRRWLEWWDVGGV